MKKQMLTSKFYSPKTIASVSLAVLLIAIAATESCVTRHKYSEAKKNESTSNKKTARLEKKVSTLQASNTVLKTQDASCESKVTNLSGEINILGNGSPTKNGDHIMTAGELVDQQNRLVILQNRIYWQQQRTELLKTKINDALYNYKPDEVMVYVTNGKIHISMQEDFIFPVGSVEVITESKRALKKVSEILNDNREINVTIEGHTDVVSVNTTIYPDNWALSTARANAIAHIMVGEYGIQPGRIAAIGRCQYAATEEKTTRLEHELNFRTEIILEPKINELMDLIYNFQYAEASAK